MEQQLEFGMTLVKKEVVVRFVTTDSCDADTRNDEVYLDRHRLKSCPNESYFINAMQKKIGRSDAFRAKTHTLGLCIMLLASRGYCITASQLEDTDNAFVERCWECLQTVSDNVTIEMSNWIRSRMDTRSAPKYSALFCQIRGTNPPVDYLGTYMNGKGMPVGSDLLCTIPSTMWHRNDVLHQAMIFHTSLGYRNLSDD